MCTRKILCAYLEPELLLGRRSHGRPVRGLGANIGQLHAPHEAIVAAAILHRDDVALFQHLQGSQRRMG